MALETKSPDSDLDPGRDPAEDEFNQLIDKNFSPGDERMMEERAHKGAEEDSAGSAESLADREEAGGEGQDDEDSFAYHRSSPHPNQVGRGYKKGAGKPNFLKRQLGNQNRMFLMGGGAALAIATLGIILFFALAPFKIMHIVNNLQSRFYASSENAVGNETDVLFSDYLKRYVMPALKKCPGEVTKSCNPIQGNSLISQLYKGWRNARLEDKLSTKYGLEFKYSKGHYYIKTTGMTGDGANIDNFASNDTGETLDDFLDNSNDPQFKKVSRSELRQSYRTALANETQWKQVLYRYKVAGLLEKKYGLKRCIIACTARDDFADWKNNKTRAAKLIVAERVLAPRSQTLALVIGCVIDGNCDPNSQSDTDSNGRKQNKVQVELQQQLAQLAAQDTGKYAAVLAHSNGILKDGYKKYITKQVINYLSGKFGGKEVSDEAANKITGTALPIIGWVNTASSTIGTLEKAPQKIKVLSYMTNAAAMVSLYTTYRVFADEAKSGNVDPTILGSFTDQLGSVDGGALGGTASAEQTPLYQNVIDGQSVNGGTSTSYKCNNGKSIPSGNLVCPEEVLGGDNSALGSINTVLGALGPLKTLADFWNNTAGTILKDTVGLLGTYLSSAFSLIPGYNSLLGYIGDAAQPIISAFTDFLIPSPFSDSMGGGRTFDLMAGGADVSGNDYAQNGLGGKALTSTQAATILNEQTQQDLQDYKNQPLLSRLFSPNNNYSLTTKLALAMPNSWSSAGQTIASIFSNPFGKLSHSFATLFSFNHAFAAATPAADPFGITQYGYLDGDPSLTQANADPEAYWSQNCSSDGKTLDWTSSTSANSQWQNTTTVDPDTGMPENTTTDPCLLLQAAVGSGGGVYDSSLLGQDQGQ